MKNIVVFSSARSGGNLLDGIVGKYKNTKILGEVFNRRHHPCYNMINDIFETHGRIDISNETLFEIINDKHRYTYDVIVTRFHNTHFSFVYNENIFDLFDNFGKILLYRENFINKLVSLTVVLSGTKKWHYSKNDELPQYDKYCIYFGRNYVKRQLDYLKDYYNGIIDRWGSENIEFVKYEDLIKNNDISHIANRFGFSYYDDTVEIPTIHINPNDDGYKRVINYDELKDLKLVLKKTNDGYRF